MRLRIELMTKHARSLLLVFVLWSSASATATPESGPQPTSEEITRALDIVKPFPARRFEALHGGWGMMADDLMAAIYANLALRAAIAMASISA